MPVQTLLASLGPEIEDPEEESFLLFSQSIPSQDLGFVDSKAKLLEISVRGRDLTIRQSPTVLSSTRDGGTTGAVVWKITPLFANWIASPGSVLFKHQILSSASSVLELGCGISGIVALALGPLVQQYTLTDQEYIMKFLNQNLLENTPHNRSTASKGRKSTYRSKKWPDTATAHNPSSNITAKSLDWEMDEVLSSLASTEGDNRGFDAVIACDCIYNDALVQSLVQTCMDACQLRKIDSQDSEAKPTVCIIAQQLRSAEVFEVWLKAFHKVFRVWRFPDEHLTTPLASHSGFAIHLGILR